MQPITVVLPHYEHPLWQDTLNQFLDSPQVEEVIVLHKGTYNGLEKRVQVISTNQVFSSETLQQLVNHVKTQFFLFISPPGLIFPGTRMFERLLQGMSMTGAVMIYADYFDQIDNSLTIHPVLDYHIGSVRNEFDFGPFQFYRTSCVRTVIEKSGLPSDIDYAGLYDLQLKLSVSEQLHHIPEPLCRKTVLTDESSGEKHFDYVKAQYRDMQVEYEKVFTDHLKRINAYLEPKFSPVPPDKQEFPVEISVIIPVLNREQTIPDAIKSIVSQKLSVPFNILIIDNHSTDQTPSIINNLAEKDSRIHHIIPEAVDLNIGGCWNEALLSPLCGRYAVQLDSDDLYAHELVLQQIYDEFQNNDYAMIIGSYTMVNFDLKIIPPGLIDHREWTPENGRNNALRINGLGAPRAYRTGIARSILFPNVGYGEDYAMVLAISRLYQIGRIYDSLYYCRRWKDNTDAALPIDKVNKNDRYKDYLRAVEIRTRQALVK